MPRGALRGALCVQQQQLLLLLLLLRGGGRASGLNVGGSAEESQTETRFCSSLVFRLWSNQSALSVVCCESCWLTHSESSANHHHLPFSASCFLSFLSSPHLKSGKRTPPPPTALRPQLVQSGGRLASWWGCSCCPC